MIGDRIVRSAVLAAFLMLEVAVAAGAVESAPASVETAAAANAYLDGLAGSWAMTGTLLGKPVRYRAHGERVLRGAFLLLHMADSAADSTYVADVFMGYDAHAADYVAHWMDNFGASGARVVATGQRADSRLILTFPYADGAFRDTFEWHPAAHAWSLLLESQEKDGSWSTFANYTLVRAKP